MADPRPPRAPRRWFTPEDRIGVALFLFTALALSIGLPICLVLLWSVAERWAAPDLWPQSLPWPTGKPFSAMLTCSAPLPPARSSHFW